MCFRINSSITTSGIREFAAPSGPPLGFVGSARSSSEIITQWQLPAEEHRNGHILGYVLRYKLHGYNETPWMIQNITNEAQKNYLITDLITWKDYIVQIAAYNDKGVGVFTNELKIKTKEGGMTSRGFHFNGKEKASDI